MIRRVSKQAFQWSLLAMCAWAPTACIPAQPSTQAAAPNYQAQAPTLAPPADIRSACFNDADLSAFRVRMVQQELAVGVLSCKAIDGTRAYDRQYMSFLTKFNPELVNNAVDLKAVVLSKHRNFDVVITEIANRAAQQPTQDAAYCSRHLRALEWSLSPSVTSLTQVPSPYDLGPEMNIFPCSGS